MSRADILIVIILTLGGWSGYRKGFLFALVTVAAVVLGALGGFTLMDNGIRYLQKEFQWQASMLPYVSFLMIFIIISIAVRILGNLVRSSIQKTIFGEVDKWLGGLLGVLKYAFAISIMLWLAGQLEVSAPESWVKDSALMPALSELIPWLGREAGEWLPFFKDLARQG